MRFILWQNAGVSNLRSEDALTRGEEVEVSFEVVLSPHYGPEEPLFDHGDSKWVFEITVQKVAHSSQRVWKTYRSPHDLWKFLRGQTGAAWELHRRQHTNPEPRLLLNELLYCSDGSRSRYLLQLIDEQERLCALRILDKHCGFHVSLYADTQDRLFWRCFKGMPGSVEPIRENGPSGFDPSVFHYDFVFECSLQDLLSLPAYEPDPSTYARWRKVLTL